MISFAEIVQGRDASVRVTDDRLLYAVDLAMVGTGHSRDYAAQIIRMIPDDVFNSHKYIERQIHAGHPTKLLSFEDAIDFIMILPGKTAKRVRKQFKDIILRYLDGDLSMCSEIETNQAMGKIKSYTQFASKVMRNINNDDMRRAHEMPQTCYVYATKSPAFPGLIKIGKTIDVTRRLSQLNTSCAPAPHVIVAVAPTFDEDRDEKTAQAFFSNARREGEFFELQDADVLSYFATHITPQYNTELAQNISRLQGLHMMG